MWRKNTIKKLGLDIVLHIESTWLERGYRVNSETGLLERLTIN